jgi:uncharacterized damage-inducible protein DinB
MAQSTVDTEISTLLSYLNGQREHVLGILEGLDEEALRRPVLPSGWTCLGLVRHIALNDERFWFRAVVAGEPVELESAESGWQVGPDVPAAAIFDLYRQEIELADAVITARTPDTAPAWWPEDLSGAGRPSSLREVMLHMISETACHAGHLDAARELIDGRRWLVLTE